MNDPLSDARLDRAFLEKYGFDEPRFRAYHARIAERSLSEASSIIPKERLAPLEPSMITAIAEPGSKDAEHYARIGREALSTGQVAVVVLNGGMATRFGGVVKGVVEVFDGETFISLKAEDVRRARERFKARIPFILMNSFATHESTMKHVEAKRGFGLPAEDLMSFVQSVSLRMNLDGSLFIGEDGLPSYHAPGHGDFFKGIRAQGVLGKLRANGVKVLLFSNVDNLGATIDPVLIGYHLASGRDMSAELTQKQRTASGEWDKGGAAAKVDGAVQLVEGFRFPADFQQEQLPDFSTNNFMFKVEGIDRNIPLEAHVVKKKVDGKPALQLETITCEGSGSRDPATGHAYLSLALFRVPREGPTGRFFPVKEPPDLEAMREKVKARLFEGWKLRDA